VESTAITRLRERTREATPVAFRRLSLASVACLYLVVTTGAVVRLTGSGLGCENWPRCGETPVPTDARGGHAIIEFSNRMVSLLAVVMALVVWLVARRVDSVPRRVERLALVVFLGTFLEIPLGGIVVFTGLTAGVVMAHFLLAMAMLALAVGLANEALRLELGGVPPLVHALVRRASPLFAAAACALVTTGAVATAAGPHPGAQKEIRRIFTVEGTVYIHVRATAVFGVMFLCGLAYLAWRREWRLLVLASGLLGILLAQMAVGEIQYRRGLPWWLVVIHVSLAAALWVWTAALVASLWRPVSRLAPDP
jgi:cytochrome c oxidase assembly protein subunit 15